MIAIRFMTKQKYIRKKNESFIPNSDLESLTLKKYVLFSCNGFHVTLPPPSGYLNLVAQK